MNEFMRNEKTRWGGRMLMLSGLLWGAGCDAPVESLGGRDLGQVRQAAASVYEAESATLSGGVVKATDHPGYSGTGFAGGFTDGNKGNAAVQFSVNTTSSGIHTATLRYANGTGSTMTLSLYVDGARVSQIALPPTANWDTWGTKAETLTNLSAGNHTVRYKFDPGDSGNVNLDKLSLEAQSTPPPTGSGPLYEAESAKLLGGAAIASDHPGYSGTGFVGGFTDGNKGSAEAQFSIQVASAATYEVSLRYANGSGVAQRLSLYVDGAKRLQTTLGATANWDTWGTRTETLKNLGVGSHTLSYKYDTTDTGNVNLDNLVVSDPLTPPPPSPPRPPGQVYEAEEQFVSGGVVNEGDYLRGFSSVGARAIFTVNSASTAAYGTSLLYLNPSSINKTLNVYVNGLRALTTSLPGTGSSAWGTKVETLTLRRGLNTITYQYDGENTGGVILDALVIPNALALASRGATLPYQELEAEAGSTNAPGIGPDRTPGSVAAESSGRRAVELTQTGHYVQWTAPQDTRSIVVRFSMPDTASGSGTDATLGLYVNGSRLQSLNLTSKHAWIYGDWPYKNSPDAPTTPGRWNPGPHRFYDEVQVLLPNTIQAGSTIKLQKDDSDRSSYTIDLIDLEQVDAPLAMPANFVSITSVGAVANDTGDDTQALTKAIADAKSGGKAGVWIPEGTFRISGKVELNNIQLRGAGPWYTRLHITSLTGDHFKATGDNVQVLDLAYVGSAFERDDENDRSAFEGNFGTGSLVQNVWIEHAKVGFWIQPPTNGLYVVDSRVRNVYADGTNIQASVLPNTGVKNTMFSHVHARNTGDDAFAIWSELGNNENCTFRYNTAQMPNLANAFAIYQGRDNKILDSVAADTYYASSGVMISDWFGNKDPKYGVVFQGTTEVKRVTLNRTGGTQADNFKMTAGALFILATRERDLSSKIVIEGLEINDSTFAGVKFAYGVQLQDPKVNNTYAISDVTLSNIAIRNSGASGLEAQYVPGTATCTNVTVTGSRGLENTNNRYNFVRGSGNSGW